MAEKTLPVYLSLEEAATVMSLSVKTIRRRMPTAPSPPTSADDAPSVSDSTTSKPHCTASHPPSDQVTHEPRSRRSIPITVVRKASSASDDE